MTGVHSQSLLVFGLLRCAFVFPLEVLKTSKHVDKGTGEIHFYLRLSGSIFVSLFPRDKPYLSFFLQPNLLKFLGTIMFIRSKQSEVTLFTFLGGHYIKKKGGEGHL